MSRRHRVRHFQHLAIGCLRAAYNEIVERVVRWVAVNVIDELNRDQRATLPELAEATRLNPYVRSFVAGFQRTAFTSWLIAVTHIVTSVKRIPLGIQWCQAGAS